MNEPFAQIGVVLPICLHLDERVFALPLNGRIIEITTHNVISEEPTWVGSAKNMEVESDEFSHFRFTGVTIKIPHEKAKVGPQEVLTAYRQPFFEVLNTFIACCRVALGRAGLRDYHDYGQFVRETVATIVGPTNPEQSAVAAFSFGSGLSSFRPHRSDEEHQKLQTLLSQGIPLTTAFMTDARNYLYYHDAIHSLLSAVIALEIAVSGAIRKLALRKDIRAEDVGTFIHDIGLTGNIKTTLRLIVPDGTQLPADAVFNGCRGAITVRNAIMHDGRRSVDRAQVHAWLADADVMIAFCTALAQ